VCKKLIKNSQPFGKKFQKTVGGIFFDSHCTPEIKSIKLTRKTRCTFYVNKWWSFDCFVNMQYWS